MLEILYFEKLDSTHKFLLKKLKEKKLHPPIMITADMQTNSIGTRGKEWISLKGNLFLSLSIYKSELPHDLPKQSVSIYFAYILKSILENHGSKAWLKWPNDFYLHDKKIGGVLSSFVEDKVVVSFGINLKKSPENFENLDIKITKNKLIEEFILNPKQVISWKYIFSKYQVEFAKSKSHATTVKLEKKSSMKDAVLLEDGSILLDGKKVYSNDE